MSTRSCCAKNSHSTNFYLQQIRTCDTEIETRLAKLEAEADPPKEAIPKPKNQRAKRKRQSDPDFDLHSPLFRLCGGVDLTQIPGIGSYNAFKLISEIGLDMNHWPTPKHFVSWLTLSANNKISGGKVLSSKTQPSANRAAKIFRVAAMSIGRSDHALGAFYRRLAPRIGKPKAITATARKTLYSYTGPFEMDSSTPNRPQLYMTKARRSVVFEHSKNAQNRLAWNSSTLLPDSSSPKQFLRRCKSLILIQPHLLYRISVEITPAPPCW